MKRNVVFRLVSCLVLLSIAVIAAVILIPKTLDRPSDQFVEKDIGKINVGLNKKRDGEPSLAPRSHTPKQDLLNRESQKLVLPNSCDDPQQEATKPAHQSRPDPFLKVEVKNRDLPTKAQDKMPSLAHQPFVVQPEQVLHIGFETSGLLIQPPFESSDAKQAFVASREERIAPQHEKPHQDITNVQEKRTQQPLVEAKNNQSLSDKSYSNHIYRPQTNPPSALKPWNTYKIDNFKSNYLVFWLMQLSHPRAPKEEIPFRVALIETLLSNKYQMHVDVSWGEETDDIGIKMRRRDFVFDYLRAVRWEDTKYQRLFLGPTEDLHLIDIDAFDDALSLPLSLGIFRDEDLDCETTFGEESDAKDLCAL